MASEPHCMGTAQTCTWPYSPAPEPHCTRCATRAHRALLTGIRALLQRQHHTNARRASLTGTRAAVHTMCKTQMLSWHTHWHQYDIAEAATQICAMHGTRAKMQRQRCTRTHKLVTGIRAMLQRQPDTDRHKALLTGTRAILQRRQQTDACEVSLTAVTALPQRQHVCRRHALP